ncbi:regulatory protein, Fis family [Capnocytophaga granulosa]|uniref:Regulatory protein, Fis family n=2 Tax=Capnocytophaga granulosa TaxID=45242 RepID=A0A1H2QZ20_9FLAO|nr:regulatory protein, Fis family [Capnocytophaga granulosa]SUX21650.1 Nitrogen assimilation regulatory protein [Capnocytophaga granulosa]
MQSFSYLKLKVLHNMDIQSVKQRFGIIGNDSKLNLAIEKAVRIAPTDVSVLITGESGVGKEAFARIIHTLSARKHAKYIAINCGAIPEGTIDSELFGFKAGSFTHSGKEDKKGYFEEANGGTIFLDEVGELPLSAQVRLLRVLENGEFIRVGDSTPRKTDVRIVAATNVKMQEALKKGRFREDLYYRLNTVEIFLPPLRERKEDIYLLFRKFASDFAQKYRMPTIQLSPEAVKELLHYRWPGNIRQLRNIAEQISVVEQKREISAETLLSYLPEDKVSHLPATVSQSKAESDFASEREILYKVLFDMRNDLNDLKQLTFKLIQEGNTPKVQEENQTLIHKIYGSEVTYPTDMNEPAMMLLSHDKAPSHVGKHGNYDFAEEIQEEEPISLQDKEVELIQKSLERHRGKRKEAAKELGISERTLYRKIKQYNIE